jgi:hypothetical protein
VAKQNEPDGDPDVSEGIRRVTESPKPSREPNGDPDVRDGLTSLTGDGSPRKR